MRKSIIKWETLIVIMAFFFFVAWRCFLLFLPSTNVINLAMSSIFWWGALYPVVAIVGTILGYSISRNWGGVRSTMGRAIFVISSGLLLQVVGGAIATYYVYFNVEALYPSWADFGFFGSVIMYIYGCILLSKTSGIKFSLKSTLNKLQAVMTPLVLLIASYIVFLKGYEFDWSAPLRIFLDFGYPLGQALYVSIAISTLILSRNILGGIMKKPVTILLIALVFQYFSDYMFLYQASHESYVPGGIVDFFYLVSYFFMSVSLVQFGIALKKIRSLE